LLGKAHNLKMMQVYGEESELKTTHQRKISKHTWRKQKPKINVRLVKYWKIKHRLTKGR